MNIYIGNLLRDVTEDDLKNAFAPFGEVESVNIIKDKFSGQSKGFGFVEMKKKEEGEAAIRGLNGTDLKGRTLTVNEARPKSDNHRRPEHGRGDRRGYGRRSW
jgi:RNA recognition motif-containing protein